MRQSYIILILILTYLLGISSFSYSETPDSMAQKLEKANHGDVIHSDYIDPARIMHYQLSRPNYTVREATRQSGKPPQENLAART